MSVRGVEQLKSVKKKKIIFTEQRVRLRDVRVRHNKPRVTFTDLTNTQGLSVDDVAPRKALITLGSEGIAVYA